MELWHDDLQWYTWETTTWADVEEFHGFSVSFLPWEGKVRMGYTIWSSLLSEGESELTILTQ
jgi:hypothetical protein